MKAISIHQPWASLILFGEKRFETRSWHPQCRGRILIHASKTFNHVEQDLCHKEPFKSVLKVHGIEFVNQLPTGAIVAVATLTNCHLVDELTEKLSPFERDFGDFRSGRYAWLLQDVKPLVNPIPYRGRQSILGQTVLWRTC